MSISPRPGRCLLNAGFLIAMTWIPAALPASAAELNTDDFPVTAEQIDALVPALMEKHYTPGVSITVIESHRIAWSRSFGVTAAGSESQVDAETVFEACSMSKPLFTFGVMKLVEEGRLDLDRPLAEYRAEPYLPDELRHLLITARMAFEHTTGFPNWREGGWRGGGALPVNSEPGTEYGYSGEGYWYVQQVVEEVIGERMEPWMQRTVLEPLGMSHSSFVWQPEFAESAAAGHDADGNMKSDRPHFERENAAYTLYTTPEDYARFLIAMMPAADAEPQVLTRSSIDQMLTPTVETDDPLVKRGLGWAITQNSGGSYVWHTGSNGTGFRCYSRFWPEHGNGIVIMTNAVGGRELWEAVVLELSGERG